MECGPLRRGPCPPCHAAALCGTQRPPEVRLLTARANGVQRRRRAGRGAAQGACWARVTQSAARGACHLLGMPPMPQPPPPASAATAAAAPASPAALLPCRRSAPWSAARWARSVALISRSSSRVSCTRWTARGLQGVGTRQGQLVLSPVRWHTNAPHTRTSHGQATADYWCVHTHTRLHAHLLVHVAGNCEYRG